MRAEFSPRTEAATAPGTSRRRVRHVWIELIDDILLVNVLTEFGPTSVRESQGHKLIGRELAGEEEDVRRVTSAEISDDVEFVCRRPSEVVDKL